LFCCDEGRICTVELNANYTARIVLLSIRSSGQAVSIRNFQAERTAREVHGTVVWTNSRSDRNRGSPSTRGRSSGV
jgi:hypothetical protein